MILTSFDNYRDYIRIYIKSLPYKGRGELSKMAKHLKINSTWLSQILNGTKDFNIDQAVELGQYLGLSEVEIEYFMLLVQFERACAHKTKSIIKKKLLAVKAENLKLKNQISYQTNLSELEKSIFYSSWTYSAVHLFTSIKEEGVSLDEIMLQFNLKRTKTLEIIQFLLKSNLCCQKNNRYLPTTNSTFIDRTSPLISKHHSNWRIKAIEKADSLNENEMMFSAPVSLSKSDFDEIRSELTSLLKKISKKIQVSKPEILAVLNLDWFHLEN